MKLAAGALAAATQGEVGLDEALAVIDGLRRLGELRRPLEEEERMRRIDDKLALLREMMAGTRRSGCPGRPSGCWQKSAPGSPRRRTGKRRVVGDGGASLSAFSRRGSPFCKFDRL